MPRMAHTGDVERARYEFHHRWGDNLRFLLEKRFSWMQPYLDPKGLNVELGSGAGFARHFLRAPRLELTDVVKHAWIDRKVDALRMPYKKGTVSVLIANNMIHHLAKPGRFFREAARVLRRGGRLLVQEINCSLSIRFALRFMQHEGYDFSVNPFDPKAVCNDPADPWSANCALPNLLFDEPAKFERHFPAFKIEEQAYSEFLIFLNSGGVIARTYYLPLPRWALRVLDRFDRALIRLWPGAFAGQRRAVLLRL